MTIIKGSSHKQDKTILEKKLLQESLEEGGEPAHAPEVHVTHFHVQQKRRCCFNIFLILLALLVLAAGIVSGVYLYKHLSKKHYKGSVTFEPIEPHYLPEQQKMMEPFHKDHVGKEKSHMKHVHMNFNRLKMKPTKPFRVQQDVEVEDNSYERIHMPKFGIFKETLVLHDFTRNYSGIVDFDEGVCYVMRLNRDKITPPRDWFDLIRKFATGYYMPKASVLKRKYRVAEGPLKDLSRFGIYIEKECSNYRTFWLEKKVGDGLIEKRSASSENCYGNFNGIDTVVEYCITQ